MLRIQYVLWRLAEAQAMHSKGALVGFIFLLNCPVVLLHIFRQDSTPVMIFFLDPGVYSIFPRRCQLPYFVLGRVRLFDLLLSDAVVLFLEFCLLSAKLQQIEAQSILPLSLAELESVMITGQ